jgi:2-polyprenyl-3-methyl-5-hydroxy-6-metoxy-1,4-benzoquinol methylase
MDAGCGAGRDLKAFFTMGYNAEGLDASKELAKLAQEYSGRPVHIMKFQEMQDKFPKLKPNELYDGVWACASLLHVPKKDFPLALDNLTNIIKPGGYLVASLKEGKGEETDSMGRFFNYVTMDEIQGIVRANPKLELDTLMLKPNTFRKGDHAFITLIAKRV